MQSSHGHTEAMANSDPDIYSKVEELFGSGGDLHGVEVSIDSLTGEIAVYSDELTPSQRDRIEESLGEVTYKPNFKRRLRLNAGRVVEELDEDDLFAPSIPARFRKNIDNVALSEDRRTVTLRFITKMPDRGDPAAGDFVGAARVIGDELEVVVVRTKLRISAVLVDAGHGRKVAVALEKPFLGTVIRDITSERTFKARPPST